MNKEITVREYMISIGKVKELKILIKNLSLYSEFDYTKKYFNLEEHKKIDNLIQEIIEKLSIKIKNKNISNENIFFNSTISIIIYDKPSTMYFYGIDRLVDGIILESYLKEEK